MSSAFKPLILIGLQAQGFRIKEIYQTEPGLLGISTDWFEITEMPWGLFEIGTVEHRSGSYYEPPDYEYVPQDENVPAHLIAATCREIKERYIKENSYDAFQPLSDDDMPF